MEDAKGVFIILLTLGILLFIEAHPWIILIIIIFICCIIFNQLLNKERCYDEANKLCSTQDYVKLKNLLQDCALINNNFSIMYIRIEQKGVTGFFHFSVGFRDLGLSVISPQKFGLEWSEKQIKSYYQSELNAQKACSNLLTAVQKATDKSYQARLNAQKNADAAFFKALFSEHASASKNFVITSPFESYASSSGSYIVDTDYWQIDGDNAIYTRLLQFESNKSKYVPYLIEKLAKELFPKYNISRFKNGCYINGPL